MTILAECRPRTDSTSWEAAATQALCTEVAFVGKDWGAVWSRFEPCESVPATREGNWLSRELEFQLFRTMDYLKFRAARLRMQLSLDVEQWELLDEFQDLLARCLQLRNALIEAFLGLANHVAAGFASPQITLDDLKSEAYLTLVRAVEIFDPSRGYRFSTYATNAIRHNLYRLVQRVQRKRQFEASSEGLEWIHGEEQGSGHRQVAQAWPIVERSVNELDAREQFIVRTRYLQSESTKVTLQTLAKQMGVSRERVRQLEQRGLAKLRHCLQAAQFEL